MRNNAIGIFDSGIGGLGIAKAIHDLLPGEKIFYLADSKRCPYGTKSPQEIQEISLENTQILLDKYETKMIVVACNTATVSAIDFLREKYPKIQFVGVVPVIKTAVEKTKTKSIAVLSTPNTLASSRYKYLLKEFASGIQVHDIACPGLADAIENGQSIQTLKSIVKQCIQAYNLKNDMLFKADVWVLGCTHYTLIEDLIRSVIGQDIELIDSNAAVARNVKYVLKKSDQLATRSTVGEITFLSTSSIAIPATLARIFPQAQLKRL